MATIPDGLPGKFFPHAVEDEQTRILIAQRALRGESVTALAAEYNVSARTVMRYRDALGGGEN
ncbi:helix-turn-helix domain-containing protein [Mycobacteroides abscessus]|uniref:helix-turn-helix domain-containing protein n=1 Tax=Mycobacteroides abscessus TaxID=36809 RepID=UPI0009419431|nr:helix-turn-helix domain-containing protein [Mycobacteroides abscessus]